jgi:hypothetical protein
MQRPLSTLSTSVFLLCLAATIPLAIVEYCSGGDAPYETMKLYATLEHLLAWTVFACIVVALAGDRIGK